MPNIAALSVEVGADISGAMSGLNTVSSAVSGFAKTAGLALVGVAVGVAGAGAAAVKSASDFEATMSGVKAVSGASASEMKQLNSLALQLGKDTAFSASEAAAGLEELVKGGISIGDIMSGAAKSTLNLAAAGGVSLPEAATIAANALAQFNLKGTDMAHVSDLIAGAANASALDVGQFKFSLQAAGAVASTVGFSFDDLAVAIAEMGKAGIVGSDAGTSLKTMFMSLQPSTKAQKEEFKRLGLTMKDGSNAFFDAHGKVKSLAEVQEILRNATKNMTEQQRLASLEILFGSDAIRAGAVLSKNGAAGYREMAAGMGKVTAEAVGLERLNNLQGDFKTLMGSVETLAITFGTTFLPVLREVTQRVTGFVNSLIPLVEQYGPKVVAVFQQISAVIGDLVHTGDITTFVTKIGVLAGVSMQPIVNAINAIDIAIQNIAGSFRSGGLIGAFVAWTGEAVKFGGFLINQLTTWGESLVNWIAPYIPRIVTMFQSFGQAIWTWLTQTAIPTTIDRLSRWGEALLGWVLPLIPPLLSNLAQIGVSVWNWITQTALPTIVSRLSTWGSAFVDWIIPIIPSVLSALGTLATNIWNWITQTALPTIVTKLSDWGSAFIGWIVPLIPGMISELARLASALWSWITDTALPTILTKLKDWGSAFVDWIRPQIPIMIIELGRLAGDLWTWITNTALPTVITKLKDWGSAFVDWVSPMIEPMVTELGKLYDRLRDWIGETAPKVLAKLGEWGKSFSDWIGPAAKQFVETDWPAALTGFLDWIEFTAAPMISKTLGSWIKAFVGWVGGDGEEGTAAGGLGKKIGDIAGVIWTFISKTAEILGPRLLSWAGKFLDWVVVDVLPFLAEKLGQILVKIGEWLRDTAIPWALENMKNLGIAIINGIIAGIKNSPNAIGDAIRNLIPGSVAVPAPSITPPVVNVGGSGPATGGGGWPAARPRFGETVVAGPDPANGKYAYQKRDANGVTVEWRDRGGLGMAGRAYAIGTPEIYIPNRPGRFVPLGGAGAMGPAGDTIIPINIGGERLTTVVAKANKRYANRGGGRGG